MINNIYEWLELPVYSNQLQIKNAMDLKKNDYNRNNCSPTEQEIKFLQFADRLINDKQLYKLYNKKLKDDLIKVKSSQSVSKENFNQKQTISKVFFPHAFKRFCRFEIYMPFALAFLYGGIQFSLATGLFSPSLESTFETMWKYSLEENGGGKRYGQDCLSLPVHPTSDTSWTVSIAKENPKKTSHEKKIQQLDALASVGFLEKYEDQIGVKDVEQGERYLIDGYRYHITTKAKAYSIGRDGICFSYGKPRFLSIDSIKEGDTAYLKHYQDIIEGVEKIVYVRGTIGYTDYSNFHSWAQNKAVIDAYELDKVLKRPVSYIFVKVNGEWLPDNVIKDPRTLAKWIDFRETRQYKKIYQIYPDDTKKTGFPYERKIRAQFDQDFNVNHYGNSAWFHVPLPGSSGPPYPVDAGNHYDCKGKYRLGMLTEKHPDSRDEISDKSRISVIKTLPYLNDLVARGILVSYPSNQVYAGLDERRGNGQRYQGNFYEASPAYREALSDCANLGRPIRYEILSVTYDDDLNILAKKTVDYFDRPTWATNSMIEEWLELKYALRYGHYYSGFERVGSASMAFDIPFEVQRSTVTR